MCAAATSAPPGFPRAATSRSPRSCSARSNYDGYFLEYDTERAGGFEPLRFVPKGNKQIVLGLVTSKSGTLEKKDDIRKRIDEATKYVALDQLCLSPQCGFASTEEGNVLTEEAQWDKMKMIVELSKGGVGLSPTLPAFRGKTGVDLSRRQNHYPGNESASRAPNIGRAPWPIRRKKASPKPSSSASRTSRTRACAR